jgi:streptogramin lyase
MKWISVFITSFICCCTSAQSFQFKTYTTKEGLSSNTISCIEKSKTGFLWIGTKNGLNRFDGNAFDVFINNPADSSTIADNYIQRIYFDSKNRMWISTAAGLSTFNQHTQQFSNYAPDTLALPKIGNSFPALCEDAAGKIWIGAEYELLIFDPGTKKFSSSGWAKFANTVKPANGNHTRVLVLSVIKKDADELWLLTTYGLFSVNTVTGNFSYYACPFTQLTDFFGCGISYADEENNIWINTYNNGILRFAAGSNTWKRYLFPPAIREKTKWDIAYGIQPFSGDTLIFCGNTSLVLFDKKKEVFLQLMDTETVKNFPPSFYFNIYRSGNQFWLQANAGLVRMTAENPLFTFQPVDVIPGIYKIGYSPARASLVIGGFYKDALFYDPVSKTGMPVKESGRAIAGGFRTYTEFSSEEACLSTGDDFYKINPVAGTATKILLPTKRFGNNSYSVRNAVKDRDGNIWVRMSDQGIAHYQPANGRMEFADFIPPAQNKEYNALYCDRASNTLFVSVKNEGLYLYDIGNKTVLHYRLNILPSQTGATIVNIIGGKNGTVYLADQNNGFFVYAISRRTFTRYTVYDGLSSNGCHWLAADTMGYVWIAGAESGLSRFDPVTKKFSNYGAAQGHPGYADFITADNKGNIYQPWQNGYYTWNSNDFMNTEPAGKIYLRHCRLDNRDIPIDTAYNFTASQNNISFQFGQLLLQSNNPVNFEYRLNNGDWLETGSGGLVAFSNLSPNRYTLTVRVKNQQQELTINFVVHWPFYKTWWFILLVVAAVASVILYAVKRRIAFIRNQAALKQKIAETEMMALRAQMNPHFIFNCISSIDNFILDNDKENASAWLNKFAKLIRGILDNSKQEVIPFWKDWETLRLYTELEQLRADHTFTCSMEADDVLLSGHYRIPPLIIQPYVENAIHHGLKHRNDASGHLRIMARLQQQQLIFTIEDNGIGRARSAELKAFNKTAHNSYGMQLSGERVQLFNATPGNVIITDLKDAAGNAAGTRVEIILAV